MNIWNHVWNRSGKKAGFAVVIAATLSMSAVLPGCGEKQVIVPDVTFANEGQGFVESAENKDAVSGGEFDKEENVQVEADATGKVKKITVETRLRSENRAGRSAAGTSAAGTSKSGTWDDSGSSVEAGTGIEDYTTLHDIKNTEGDEEFRTAGDGRLFWEDRGEDIHYEGISTSELPVVMQISYELDGKKIMPEKLAGRSGRLKMRFDYENRTKEIVAVGEKDVEVCVPFTVLTMVVLPEKVFSDVEVKNGKLLSMGDDRIAMGYAFPGLGQSLKLSEMEDFEDVEIPEYVEITAQVTDFELDFTATVITPGLLEDFDTDDLEDIEELIDDMDELRDASKELVDGTKELADGVDEFGDYLQEYVDAMDELRNGTLKLWESTRELGKYAGQLENGAKALQDGLEMLQKSLAGSGTAGSGAAGSAGSGTSGTAAGTVSGGDSGTGSDSAGNNGDMGASSGVAQTDLTANMEELQALLGDMNARLTRLESSVDGNDTDSQQEIAVLKQEIAVLGQALEGLSETMTETMTEAAQAQAQLSTAVGQLAVGSAKLTEGLAAFGEGITAFGEGASALDDGAVEIRDAGRELRDGYDELVDGVGEFRDGVKEFDEEGIQKLADLAGEDLQNLVDRIRALKEADGRYINFGGILPGKTGSVRFIIETDEIKK